MAACLDHSGMIWVMGDNNYGELGVGDNTARINPYPLIGLKGKNVMSLAIGSNFTLALSH